MRHRIVLCGFSEFEHRAMHFSFSHPAAGGGPGYDVVTSLDEADFAVVDADSASAVEGVVRAARVADAVFVGAVAPAGALSHLQRPIDPTRILRAVSELRSMHAMSDLSGEPPGSSHAGLPTLDDLVLAPLVAPRKPTRAWDRRADDPAPSSFASLKPIASIDSVIPAASPSPAQPGPAPAPAPAPEQAQAPAPDDANDALDTTGPVTLSGPFGPDGPSTDAPPITLIDPVLTDDALQSPLPSVSPFVVTDPPVAPLLPDTPASRATPATPAPSAAHAAKAAARAAARRARLAAEQALHASQPASRDVLVLDADADASAVLCDLLLLFGFDVHAVRSPEAAQAELAQRRYAAVFLDTALDGPGLEMVHQIQSASASSGPGRTAIVLVRTRLHPAERVRAVLAGIGEPLLKPVSRGGVARALEALGVALPVDARRI